MSAQNIDASRDDAPRVEGSVRKPGGELVAGATVSIREKSGTKLAEMKTGADGTFNFAVPQPGTYILTAQKAGWRDASSGPLELAAGDKKRMDLILEPEKPSTAARSDVMEFDDKPNFTVAGIKDWSNIGTHGSDVRARTSEELARETVVLKSDAPNETSPNASKNAEAEAHRIAGDSYERASDSVAAVREYEQAARIDPNERNYFDWGTELLLHKAPIPAIEVFTKGSAAHPHSPRMLIGLAVAQYAAGSYDDAARRLCEAADLEPSDFVPYLFLGMIEKTTPELLPCSEEKLGRFARSHPAHILANYYYALALLKRAKGIQESAGLRNAEGLLSKVVLLDSAFADAHLQLGILSEDRRAFGLAINEYKKAIKADPKLGEAHYRLGLLYRRLGEGTRSQRELQIYEQIEKEELADVERGRREIGQFVIILKQRSGGAPH